MQAVKLDSDQIITASHMFGSVIFSQNITVTGLLNGVDTEDILLTDTEQSITGELAALSQLENLLSYCKPEIPGSLFLYVFMQVSVDL